jgi:hypothetical protein
MAALGLPASDRAAIPGQQATWSGSAGQVSSHDDEARAAFTDEVDQFFTSYGYTTTIASSQDSDRVAGAKTKKQKKMKKKKKKKKKKSPHKMP